MKVFDNWFPVYNYVYNKTLEKIKGGHKVNFIELRDLLVTKNTKKTHPRYKEKSEEISLLRKSKTKENSTEISLQINQKNRELRELAKTLEAVRTDVPEWSLEVPKEIRASAVKDVCRAYDTARTNFRNGNIKHFDVKYRKKRLCTSIAIQGSFINIVNIKNVPYIKLAPDSFDDEECYFHLGKKTKKKLQPNFKIEKDSRLVKQGRKYYLCISVSIPEPDQEPTDQEPTEKEEEKSKNLKFCGVDIGVRTFLNSYGSSEDTEYNFRMDLVAKLNNRIKIIKQKMFERSQKPQIKGTKRIRKRALVKIEIKKENFINELHWKSIKHLLDNNDVVFIGDIKSHNIVKNKENQKCLNRNVNDLKFYKFKQRLLYKASTRGKFVKYINEAYTTQTCSHCGENNKPGSSKVYCCSKCKTKVDRDANASKNILMKGLIKYQVF